MGNSTWISWSSGKDSAFALFKLQNSNEFEVKAILTTVNQDFERVAMHSTRLELLNMQSESLGLPLEIVEIPKNCSNKVYQENFLKALNTAESYGVQNIAYGDLFLEDIRAYREDLHKNLSLKPLFPIWESSTDVLAKQLIDYGFEAYLTCVDPKKLPASFAGRKFDYELLRDLPKGIDPCGENGEFHSFVFNGPNFSFPIQCAVGETVERDGFIFADIYSR